MHKISIILTVAVAQLGTCWARAAEQGIEELASVAVNGAQTDVINDERHAHIAQHPTEWITEGRSHQHTAVPMGGRLTAVPDSDSTSRATLVMSLTGIVRLKETPSRLASSIEIGFLNVLTNKWISVSTWFQVAEHSVQNHWVPFSVTAVVPLSGLGEVEIAPGVVPTLDNPRWELRRTWLEVAVIGDGATLRVDPIDGEWTTINVPCGSFEEGQHCFIPNSLPRVNGPWGCDQSAVVETASNAFGPAHGARMLEFGLVASYTDVWRVVRLPLDLVEALSSGQEVDFKVGGSFRRIESESQRRRVILELYPYDKVPAAKNDLLDAVDGVHFIKSVADLPSSRWERIEVHGRLPRTATHVGVAISAQGMPWLAHVPGPFADNITLQWRVSAGEHNISDDRCQDETRECHD